MFLNDRTLYSKLFGLGRYCTQRLVLFFCVVQRLGNSCSVVDWKIFTTTKWIIWMDLYVEYAWILKQFWTGMRNCLNPVGYRIETVTINTHNWMILVNAICYIVFKMMVLSNLSVSDKFVSQLLCGTCSTDLKKFHLFIEKAIETHTTLQRRYTECFSEGICQDGLKIELDHEIECVYMVDQLSNHTEDFQETSSDVVKEDGPFDLADPQTKKVFRGIQITRGNLNTSSIEEACTQTSLGGKEREINEDDGNVMEHIRRTDEDEKKEQQFTPHNGRIENENNKDSKAKQRKATTPVMCSYCCKLKKC